MHLELQAGDLALLTAIAGPDVQKQGEWLLKQIRKALNRQPDGPLIREFDNDFWPYYPRKVAVGAARSAYVKARLKTDAGTIMRGLAAYVEHVRTSERKFIAHASTWLNEERWADVYEVASPAPVSVAPDPHLAVRKNLDHLLATNRWISRDPDPRQHWPSWWPRSLWQEYQPKFAAKGLSLPGIT